MPLIYSFVARGTTVLAEHTPFSGNFNTVAIECLQRINNPESKFTIACDRHTFNFLVHDAFTYLVVADEAYGRQIPFAFLERVRDEFEEKFADMGRISPAHSLDRTFGVRLKSHMEYCMKHPEEISKLAAVQKKVADVKDVMMENIEKVLERGEKIELLVDKADNLQNQAVQFQRKGKQLRRAMWWQNCRMKLAVICLVLVLAVVIFLIVCFSSGNNCIKSAQNAFSPTPTPTPATSPPPPPVLSPLPPPAPIVSPPPPVTSSPPTAVSSPPPTTVTSPPPPTVSSPPPASSPSPPSA